MGKRSYPHPPDYSLLPGTMVAGRYLVQAYLGESEEAIYYRCYDQMRKTVVELMEFFPVGQVQRFQSSGDRRLHPIYGHEEEFVRAANHFAGIYPNHVQDHGTVYAVRTNKKSSKIGILLVSMFVLCLILGVIMEIMRSGNSGIPGDETLTYANGDYLFRPGIENICYDEESSVIYFDRILLVYLDSEFTEEEAKRLSSIVKGEVVGEVKGIMNILQLKLAKSDFSRMEALAVRLMEEENVLFAGYDYPTVLESTGLQGYDYNRWGKTDLVYPGTSRTDPYTEKVYYCEFDEDSPSGNEWWAEAIGAYTAWTYAEYGEDYTVGIIDSGVDMDDPELKGRATSLAGIANHLDSHGTFVAGLIGAEDNNDGIRGVADNAKMLTADWEEKPQGDSLSYGYDPLEDLRGLKKTQSDDEIPANYLDSVEIFELHKQMLEQGVRVVNDSWTRYLMPENEFDRWYKLARIRPNNRPAEHVMTYEEYKSAYESVNYRTALDAMLCIDQLIKSGKKDFLFIQAAGNGFGNYMINGTDSKNAGYFASITSEHYEQFNNSYDQHLSHTTTIPFELVYGYGKLTIPYEEIREL
ncbi:MAG: hypothetical protein EOM40_03345 [Clostridia bacterium]|nr:hypothetical protein [Clostridia bacterium]